MIDFLISFLQILGRNLAIVAGFCVLMVLAGVLASYAERKGGRR